VIFVNYYIKQIT